MRKKNLLPVSCVCLLLVALGALIAPYGILSAPDPRDAAGETRRDVTAEQTVQRAWLLAQVSGAYNFHTELEQTTYYAPALTNVGRPAQVETLYLEGQADAPNQTLQLAIWQGGSTLNPADALEVRIANGKAYGRANGSDWQAMDDFSGVFAPAQDPLAYLHGAKDIVEITPDAASYRQFSFTADGPTFARYIRGQLEDELRRSGKLPANLTLDTSRVYRDMLGAGQLWLTDAGLPLRLVMDIEFPQQSDGSRVKASIRSDFSGFQTQATGDKNAPLLGVAFNSNTPPVFANLAARLWLVNWAGVARQLALTCLFGMLVLALSVWRQRRLVYATLSVIIIFMMVFSPLLDSQRAYAFYQEQSAAAQKHEADRAALAAQQDMEMRLRSNWEATQDPLAAAPSLLEQQPSDAPLTLTSLSNLSSIAQSTSLDLTDADNDGVPDVYEPAGCVGRMDCDNDGLTDLQEYRLGIRLNNPDSDGDGLSDSLEVAGFGVTDKTLASKWYSNPHSIDSNMDGIPDNMECWTDATFTLIRNSLPSNTSCDRDSDGDGVPDIWDADNDGDGIDDSRDLSPFHVSPQTYDQNNPFLLQVNGLTSNEPLFVDLQLVPINRDQVSYARNVLDWPSGDTQGQVRRAADNTFADTLTAAQRQADPSAANGDIRLVPLVEIKIPAADAGNLLPRTQTATTRRSLTGYYEAKTGSGANVKTELQVWAQAHIEFRAQGGSTSLAFTNLTNATGDAITVDRVKLFSTSSCPVSPNAAPRYQKTTPTTTGDVWNLGQIPLPDILNSNYVIMLEQGSGDALKTACLPLGDIPNGTLPAGWMFDSAKLDSYGVSLRDVVDANGAPTHVIAYAPANVVVGRTGGEKQAFGARIPYWPGNVTSLGAAHEVRLVWLVQLLDDDGRIQIIHTYPNESWRMGGLAARQDLEVRSAVLYQNPDYAGASNHDKWVQSYIWKAAQVLGSRFAIDRVGKARLALDGNLMTNLQNIYRFPAGSLGVVQTTYETQDEVARIPKEVTNDNILPRFVASGALKAGYTHALLLFAREEVYKSTVWAGGALELPSAPSTLASYSWKPFRYTNSGWELYPLQAYLDLVGVAMGDIIAAGGAGLPDYAADPVARQGMVLADQMFALGMFYGGNQMINIQNIAIETPDDEDATSPLETIGEQIIGKVLSFVANEIVAELDLDAAATTKANAFRALGQILEGQPPEYRDRTGAMAGAMAIGAVGLTVASYAVAATGLALTIAGLLGQDVETAANIIDDVAQTLDMVSAVIGAVDAVKDAYTAIKDAGGVLKAINSSTNAIGKAAIIAAVVALVITIAIAVGMFIAQWAMGAFGIADLAFTAALAAVFATIIVAVIMFAIGLIPIVGPLIVAIIGLIDAAIAGICAISKKAGYDLEEQASYQVPRTNIQLSFCAGLTGLMTEGVKFTIFSQNVLVGNMYDADRLKTSNFMLGMVDPSVGFQVGNAIKPVLRVDNKIELIDQPIDWKSALYFWQINWDILDNTTHRYDLTVDDETERKVRLSQMESEWQELRNGQLTGGHRSPGIQYDDPLHMVPATARITDEKVSAVFEQIGINVPVSLYLREAYANPTQECFWIPPLPPFFIFLPPVCYIRSDSGTNHIDMKLAFDIFPTTLDAFYAPYTTGDGVSLDWGQEGDVTFPVMMDFDGDGLLSQAYGGNDPNDSRWDSDGDGLSDLFELQIGAKPSLADTDGDGLTDRQEAILGANPLLADTDGDGLIDCEEVFHEVLAHDQFGRCGGQIGQWRGGWEFVYDLRNGVPLKTWVGSDPTQIDGDGDGFTDYQEKLYGLHPLVTSDPQILNLESQVREAGAPAMLLRFEERAGANLFGDISGLINNATCTGASCPTAGHEGRYTNGVVFDGADDRIAVSNPGGLTNQSFTVAFWAKRADTATTDRFVFSSGSAQVNRGLHIGFRDNRFMCAFWSNDLTTPATYTDTDWHHWACTYNTVNRQRIIYRDGVVVAQDTASASYQGSGDWYIGGVFNNTGYFNGALDEVAVFPTALNATQVQTTMAARYNPGGAQVVVGPGDALAYDATLTNNLLGKQLTGLLDVQTPPGWSRQVAPLTYRLPPAGTQTIQGSVTAGGASGAYSLTLTAGAAASDPSPQPDPPVVLPAPHNYPANPWLYLPFEGNYNDASGNGRHAWLASGTPQFQLGFKSQALNFIQTNKDALNLPGAVSNTDNFTFAAWVYWRGGSEWQRIFDFGKDTNNFMTLTPWDEYQHVRLQIRKGNTWQDVFTYRWTMPHNTWTHVAVVLNSSTNSGKIYINGVDRTEATGPITIRPNEIAGANSRLGGPDKWNNGHTYFNGTMDEVFIYHRALSAQEVQQLALSGVTTRANFPANPTPRVYLPFDAHYLDYQNNDLPKGGALPIGTAPNPTFVAGRQNEALNFNGNNYVKLPSFVADASAFTFAAWVYWRGGGDWQRIFDFGKSKCDHIMLTPRDRAGNVRLQLRAGCGDVYYSPQQVNFPLNTWTHVAVTYQDSNRTAYFYFNGVFAFGVSNFPYTLKSIAGDNSYLGKSNYDDPLFNGMLDEVYIFHDALNQTQIQNLLRFGVTDVHFGFEDPEPLAYAPNRYAPGAPFLYAKAPNRGSTTGIDGKQALMLMGQRVEAASAAFNVAQAPFMAATDFTYSFWVKPESHVSQHSGIRTVWAQSDQTITGSYLRIREGRDVQFGWGGAQPWDTGWQNNLLRSGAWNHIAVTFIHSGTAAGALRLYVNGDPVGEYNVGTQRPPVTFSFAFGPNSDFIGAIDELRLHRRAYTDAEIRALYLEHAMPYRFPLDEPAGAGLNTNVFNFGNYGGLVNTSVRGTCNPGNCPTSGVQGRINQAVQFESHQSIQIPNLVVSQHGSPGFSLWVNPALSAAGQILKIEGAGAVLTVSRSGNTFCLNGNCGGNYAAGQWHHLMLVFANHNSDAWLYVNGQAVANAYAWPGPSVTLGGGFNGSLDDFRVSYNGSTSAVGQMLRTAPVVLLHLDERAQTTSFENVGGVNATCSGDACPTAGLKGRITRAARFDGLDDGLAVPHSDALNLPAYTLAAWVKPTAGQNLSGWQTIAAKADGAYRNYALYLNQERRIITSQYCGGTNLQLTSVNPLPLNQFTHVAVSYDGRRMTLYINGLPQAVVAEGALTCFNNAPFTLGKPHNGDYRPFSGELDEVQLYTYALSAAQIQAIFAHEINWIEEENAYTIQVDADNPTSSLTSTLPNPTTYFVNQDVQVGVTAQDPTSLVALLELGVSRNGGAVTWTAAEACQDASGGTATGSPAWCPWFKPTTLGGEGRYALQTRATDAVGNRETPAAARTILVDATGPTLVVAQANGSLQALQSHPTQANSQVLNLSGTVSDPNLSSGDPGSGVAAVWVTLRDVDGNGVGDAPYPATVSGGAWTLAYPFALAQVAGPYYLEVLASDAAGNVTTLPARTLYLDGTAPGVELDEIASALPLTRTGSFVTATTTLRGVASEWPFPTGARAVYHWEESAGATSFANAVASSGWQDPGYATCAGATCPAAGGAGLAGKGLNLDGSDDYVTLPQSVAQTNDFTFAAWVYWRGGGIWQRIFDFGQDTNQYLLLTPSNGSVMRFAIKSGGTEQTLDAAPLPTNAWTHVAVTLQGDTGALYVNGVKVREATITLNPAQSSGSNTWLGRSQYPDPYFNGQLDEVAIYARALSADEIRVLAALQLSVSGLQAAVVAFTPLWVDATSGAASPHISSVLAGQTLYLPLNDARGQNGNITFRNLARPNATAYCQGVYCPEPGDRSPGGPAVRFAGTNTYLDLPWDTWRDNFSFATWVYWEGGSAAILSSNRGTSSVKLQIGSDGQLGFVVHYNNQYQSLWGPVLPKDAWVHLALSLQDTNCVLYVNGQQAAQTTITHPLSQAAGSWAMLGMFKGQMSDVRAFSRGLSAAEALALWRGTGPLLVLPFDQPLFVMENTVPDTSGWQQTATFFTEHGDGVKQAVAGVGSPYALRTDMDAIVIVNEKTPLANQSFSVAFWVQRNDLSGTDQFVFVSGDPSNNRGLHIGFRNNRFMCGFWGNDLTSPAQYFETDWHHWACTYDVLTGRRGIYRDGALVAQDTAASYQGAGDWHIGINSLGLGTLFSGALDDLRVYPRPLLAVEVADLASVGWRSVSLSGGQAAWSLPIPAGLEGAYRLDLRGMDNGGRYSFNGQKAAPNQTIDSRPPRVTATRRADVWGSYYNYTFTAEDLYLSKTGLSVPTCQYGDSWLGPVQEIYRLDPATGQSVLSKLIVECNRWSPVNASGTFCDAAGNCTTVNTTQAQAAPTSLLAELGGRSVLARALPAGLPDVYAHPAALTPGGSRALPAYLPVAALRTSTPRVGLAAPTAGETCFATLDDGATVYSSTTASAVRDAIAAAGADGTVKIAGYCAGVQTDHLATIYITLTLAGGYTLTNWITPDLAANPTVLDVQNGGRGIFTAAPVTLTGLTIQNGMFTGTGGGAFFYGPATLADVTFSNNTAMGDAGGAHFSYAATLTNVTFINNTAADGNGGGAMFFDAASMVNTTFTGNRASADGGGAAFAYGTGQRLVNGLFARNQAINGAAVSVAYGAALDLVHTTIVSPTQAAGSAVYVVDSTVNLTNTIVAAHTTGIDNPFDGVVTAWNPLFFGNTNDTVGTVTVDNPMLGDPAFVNQAGDDYHLTAASAAINAGVTPTPDVTADFEGDPRPQQGGYDIGYDESPFNTPPVITPTAGLGGSITPATPQRIAYGDDITFTITPDVDYTILDVVVDSVSQGPVAEYAFVNVQTDHTIAATFAATTPITPGTFEFVDLPGVITILSDTVQLKGRVGAPNSLTALQVWLDQTPLLDETYPPDTVFSYSFDLPWTPTQDGVYLLTAQATDALSGTAAISATLFVDTDYPDALLDTAVYTGATYAPGAGVVFRGVAMDATGIVSAAATLDVGSGPQPLYLTLAGGETPAGYLAGQAIYTHTAWSAAWWEFDTLPDNINGTLALTLYDATLAPVTYYFGVIVDIAPPDFGVIALRANGVPITTMRQTYTTSPLETTAHFAAVTDGAPVSLWYGWTETYTATLAELTPTADPTVAFTHTQTFVRAVADGGAAYFFHVYAVDAWGNVSTARFGPYYHDLPGMPDYISVPGSGDGFTSGVYRAWQTNPCTLLGVDQRIPGQGLREAALYDAQALYLTWNDDRLHFVWRGADWETDGDLFIYLDTLPDQADPYQRVGSGAAYNPYPSTAASTVLLLPTQEWSNDPNFTPPAGAPVVDAMHADYALWVKNRAEARLLRWDNVGQQWVDDGDLNTLGGAYALDVTVDGAFTDLLVPFALVGNPQDWVAPFPGLGPEGMGVVALAVDAEAGPSGGLRIWSILPYANPADSARVMPNALAADQPHLLMLTDRYIVPVVDEACFAPEANLQLYLTAEVDRFAYNSFADSIRLIVPAPAVNPNAWDGLFDPYDDVFRAWLTADYCPANPTYPACRASKPPAELSVAELLAGLIDSQHPPLLPGSLVTYTLYYVNPAETALAAPAYLYSNENLANPLSGVAFAGQAWSGGCPGWLSLAMQPGFGQFIFTGTVQAAGVSAVTLDIAPSYSAGASCAIVPGDGSWPDYRLTAQHTPDDGAPSFIAIRPDFTVAGPLSATIPGVVVDASPVGALEIQVNGTFTFACVDDTFTDGQWQCLWDIPASNGGQPPANGVEFTLRARATDAFGNVSAWSDPQPVLIDTQSPEFGEGTAGRMRLTAHTAATPTLLSDLSLYLSGSLHDNTVPQSVELCTPPADGAAGENCAAANLTLDPWTVPPTAYNYAETLTTPVTIDAAVCGAGAVGLARTFEITDSFTIGGLEAGLRLAHPYRSDLSARLQSPAGTQVTLFSFTKNVLAENVNVLFTDLSLVRLTDDLTNHDLDAPYTQHSYRPQENLAAFKGEEAAGTWTLTLCDSDPANDTGAFYAAALNFAAVAPPLNISGEWSYTFDASGSDGDLYTWQLYATDIHGNRTAQPYSLTVQVDNVAPVITATQTVTRLLVSQGAEILHGMATDGDVVSDLWVLITDPVGGVWRDSVHGTADAWTYTFTPTLGGEHTFVIYATDRAGNQAGVGTFSLMAGQPLNVQQTVTPDYDVQAGELVTYTLWVYNDNADTDADHVIITSTLNRWLTPVETAGAAFVAAQPDNYLVWPARSLAAGDVLSLTVSARMPDTLFLLIPRLITETTPVTRTYIITEQVDLHGALFTSQASLSTANLGDSQAYASSFSVAPPLVQVSKAVTPTDAVPLGSVVTYTLRLDNTSAFTVTDIVVEDPLHLALAPEDLGSATYDSATRVLAWPARNFAPGESITYTFSARLTTDENLIGGTPLDVDNQALLRNDREQTLSNMTVFRTSVAPPTAYFTATPLSGASPLAVKFFDLSTNLPHTWLWDFGDGVISTLAYPVHTYTYTTPGVYTVILTVTNAGGSDSVTRFNYITVEEPAYIFYLPLIFRNSPDP